MKNQTAYFERFYIELPDECVADCAAQGSCDAAVAHWAPRIPRGADITPERLAAELKEYGAWDAKELADDGANWQRIIWIAAGYIKEEQSAAE